MKKKRCLIRLAGYALLLAVLTVTALCGCACQQGIPDYFSYQTSDFTAEIRGTLHGVPFSALLNGKTSATGERILHMTYLSPSVLSDVELERYPDGSVQILCGDLALSSDRDALAGLLLPADLLLSPPAEIVAVHKENGVTHLSLPNERTLALSQSGVPLSAASSNCSLDVVWWE